MGAAQGGAASAVRGAARSDTAKGIGRAGLAGRGVLYVMLGIIALLLAFGRRSGEADQRGAFRELAQGTGGKIVLLTLAVGLLAYAVWQVTQLIREHDKSERFQAFWGALMYASLAVTAFTTAVQGGSKSQARTDQAWSARVMQHDFGRWAIGLLGVIIVCVGAYFAWTGISRSVDDDMDLHRLRPAARRAVVLTGVVGTIARGIVVGLSGILVLVAAIEFDPKKASGIDQALRTLRDAPAGPIVLALVALGLMLFGVFGLCEARYRRV